MAALTLIEINIGVLAFLEPRSLFWRILVKPSYLSFRSMELPLFACSFPASSMKAHLGVAQHARSPFWSLLRCSQRCLFSFNPRGTHSVEFRDSIVATAAFLCTFTAILLVLEIQGVALTRVLRALLLDSLGPATSCTDLGTSPCPSRSDLEGGISRIIGGLVAGGLLHARLPNRNVGKPS